MEELRVDMYVRTNKIGIQQIYRINDNATRYKYAYKLKNQDGDSFIDCGVLADEHIIKASNNIIDLIEVGDVIVGKDGHKFEVYAVGGDCVYINGLKEFILIDEIKAIVTKEQFSQMEYKIESEVN